MGTERGMDVGFIVLVGSRLSSESVRVERRMTQARARGTPSTGKRNETVDGRA